MAKNSGDYCPAQGDIVWLDFDPIKGHEQGGKRPAVVISPTKYNERSGLCIVCPITSKQKNYSFEIEIHGKIKGVVLCNHIKTIDYAQRNASYADKISFAVLQEIKEKIELLLP